jgi:hypothetical protein
LAPDPTAELLNGFNEPRRFSGEFGQPLASATRLLGLHQLSDHPCHALAQHVTVLAGQQLSASWAAIILGPSAIVVAFAIRPKRPADRGR